MVAAWERASAGPQQAVAISGEPGIGKTRLAAELAGVVSAAGGIVLHGRADEDLGTPYKPFIEALTHYMRHADAAAVRRQLGPDGRELFRLLPGLAERFADLGLPTRTDAAAERFLLFEAVTTFIARVAEDAPVLFVLDDVHWADKPTLLLMHQLASRTARLLVVFTYRDTEVTRRHPLTDIIAALHRDHVLERIALAAISADDVPAFAAHLEALDVDDAFWSRVHRQTGGNPFFIEEVLRHAADLGTGDVAVPEGVEEMVVHRVARLSDAANRVLTVGALCGLEFDTTAVELGTDLDDDAVLDALDEAAAAGVITEVTDAPGRWAFGHALVRQSLHDSLSAARRVRVHWRIGEGLAARAGSSAAEIANHLVAGAATGDPSRAAEACLAAADEARRLAGFEVIVRHADRAVAVLTEHGVSDPDLEYRAAMAQADALYALADILGSVEAYRRAAEVARGLDATRFADAVIGFAGPVRIEPDPLVEAYLHEALDAVGPAPSAHRVRLLAEQIDHTVVWFGRGPLAPVLADMTAAAEPLDDPVALAAAARAEGRYWHGSSDIDALRRTNAAGSR